MVSIAQAEFWGTRCAGVFLSRSPKSEEKVFVDLPWFTQNDFIEHLLYASTGSYYFGEMGGGEAGSSMGSQDRVGNGE